MLSELGRRPVLGGNEGSLGEDFEKEISMLLREQRRQDSDDLEKELNLYRSGSAPPTVEGSLSAVGGLLNRGGGGGGGGGFPGLVNGNGFVSEEELRSDPAYLSYYYSNVNLNPRLPPPLLSKEDWRSAQRLQGGSSVVGGIGDRRKVDRNSSIGGGRSTRIVGGNETSPEKINGSQEWAGDGLIGLPGISLGGKQKSFADIFQDDLGRTAPGFGNPSRSANRNGFENSESFVSAEDELGLMHNEVSADGVPSNVKDQNASTVQSAGVPVSYSYAAALGASLSRSTTPDPQHIARAPSPGLAPIGGERANMSERRSAKSPNPFNSVSVPMAESVDLVNALSGMKLSNGGADTGTHVQSPYMKKSESGNKVMYSDSGRSNGAGPDLSNSFLSDMHANMQKIAPNKSYINGSPTSTQSNRGSVRAHHQQMGSPNSSYLNYGAGGFSPNTALPSMMTGQLDTNMPPLYENVAAASAMGLPGVDSRMFGAGFPMGSNLGPASLESQNLNRLRQHMAVSGIQTPLVDPMYLQYLTQAEYATLQAAALNDYPMDMNFSGNSQMDLLQKAYMGSLLSPKAQYGGHMGTKTGGSNHHGYYGTPPYGVGLSYPGSPLASSVMPNSPGGPGSPMAYGDLNMHFSSGMRNLSGGVMGPWHLQAGRSMDDRFASSLLEEFKSNKTKYFELSEIAGHVVEFSADQYGSRFIQQKLETATLEEKNMVFDEIIPQALTLMTDVFGNYVVQKFFEHGIASQIRELASNLTGHVLTLSLQMYGCRVIQKAIEVVDLDQKIGMVGELDGHVIRCVRDQNGNHVIQKCIECVPEENIQFIVSTFSDQVVSLSTHPYGCRVVQRILEHCNDPKTQSKVMDEILGSVSMLAQDQYGNYVIQHVLEHGKPHERSAIIEELAGRIVQMSQQKFASNVVEKCLTFCGPTERQILVNEMLGTTDENEPLQAMMKDQFANYVVQKVLETCNDQQRELILTRIKVHLNALKKYTYGKHIVARVEKLVAAGERRSAVQNSQAAYMA